MSELCSLLNLHPQIIRDWFHKKNEEFIKSKQSTGESDAQGGDSRDKEVRKEVQGALSAKPKRVTKTLRTEMRKMRNRRKRK